LLFQASEDKPSSQARKCGKAGTQSMGKARNKDKRPTCKQERPARKLGASKRGSKKVHLNFQFIGKQAIVMNK
jgi:hypothetical protein